MKTNNWSNVAKTNARTLTDIGADLSRTVEALSLTFNDLARHQPCDCRTSAGLYTQASNIMAHARQLVAENAARAANLERLAVTDELTGLFNRRGFLQQCERALASAERYGEHGVLVYIDLDGFKPINDTYGHAAGDKVLKQVAQVLSANIRRTDFVGRLGGDEFAVMLVRTARNDGAARAQAIQALVGNLHVPWENRTIAIGASCGTQTYSRGSKLADLLHSADNAMYRAKSKDESPAPSRLPTKPKSSMVIGSMTLPLPAF